MSGALLVQRLGAVRLRDAGVADQHVSQTVVCDTPARTPSNQRRRVSYPVSDSMSCRRRARGPDVLQLLKSGQRTIGRVDRAPSHAATSNSLLMN